MNRFKSCCTVGKPKDKFSEDWFLYDEFVMRETVKMYIKRCVRKEMSNSENFLIKLNKIQKRNGM